MLYVGPFVNDIRTSTLTECGQNVDWIARLDKLLQPTSYYPSEIHDIIEDVRSGIDLDFNQSLTLYQHPDLSLITHIANAIKQSRFGTEVYFNSNLHVNHTNICTLACKFCAFRRGRRASDAYALSIEEFIERIVPFEHHIDEIHTVGGLHPEWKIEYFEALFTAVKLRFPNISIKSLTAVEVKHISELSQISVSDTLTRLRRAGLDSLPGGGAEILDDNIRDIICKGKETSDEYLDVHRQAHQLGIPTNCTMLFGTIENPEHRIRHLLSLRKLPYLSVSIVFK